MDKIEKMKAFYEWMYETVKSVHTITTVEFENIIEKL